jgi:hypothetical protein
MASRALKQQQQQPQGLGGLGDLLSNLGLGQNAGGPNNPNNNANLAEAINRAVSQIPAQQRINEDDGTQQTISARDGRNRASATASGDQTSVDASADDGDARTLPEVTRSDDGIAGDDDVAARGPVSDDEVRPATSASRAVSTTPGRPAVASASASPFGDDNEEDYPENDNDDQAELEADQQDADDAAPVVRQDVDEGLQRAGEGINGTYGAIAGILSNLTGGAFTLPPLDTDGTQATARRSTGAQVEDAPPSRSAVQELISGGAAQTSGAGAKAAASTLVAAVAGGAALLAMVAF